MSASCRHSPACTMPWTLRYQRFDKPYQTLMVNSQSKGPRLIIFILRKQNKTALFVWTKNLFAVLNYSMQTGIQDFVGSISGHISPRCSVQLWTKTNTHTHTLEIHQNSHPNWQTSRLQVRESIATHQSRPFTVNRYNEFKKWFSISEWKIQDLPWRSRCL